MRRPLVPMLLALTLLGACSGGSDHDDAATATTTVEDADACRGTGTIARRDVRYSSIEGVEPDLLSLDLYLPEVPERCAPVPVVVYVHGGGFVTGDRRRNVDDKIALFNGEGWAFASVNYRLSPRPAAPEDPDRVMYPDQNHDLAAALGWLHDHAPDLGIDATRIALMGHSAGAFLVALQATDPSFDEAEGVAATDVVCTVPLDTSTYDIRLAAGDRRAANVMFRNAFGDDPAVREAASPLAQVASGEHLGAFLIVTHLPEGRDAAARDFAAALTSVGVDTEVLAASTYGHAEINDAVGRPGERVVTPRLTQFLRGCLAPED